MSKNILFLDLDDTILDFHRSEDFALRKTLTELHIEPTDEMVALYSRINDDCWKKLERGEMTREQVIERINFGGRDHSRLPMQWDASENVGFTTGTPWIKPAEHSEVYNAEAQMADPDSVFSAYKKLISLRKSSHALRYGKFIPAKKCPKELFCFTRKGKDGCYYIEINMSDRTVKHGPVPKNKKPVYCSYGATEKKLRPYEANISLC